jgi:DNA repair photolyase
MARPVSNPPNPWSSTSVDYLGEPPAARIQVFEEDAREVLTRNDSPDVPFDWSVNPYRGCQHACSYCYARRTHEFLDWGAGTDFDTKIVVKRNAPERLAEALAKRRNKGAAVAFSGVTDCYQPLEASYELTRRCLQVCLDFKNPVGILTKAALIRRDVDLLAKLHEVAGVQIYISIPFADPTQQRAVEPSASAPAARFGAIRALAEAGIPVGVAIAPVIPALNDSQIPTILERAAEAGASSAFMVLLRLSEPTRTVFTERLQQSFPERAAHVLSALADTRSKVSPSERTQLGTRMSGKGARWDTITGLFELHCRKLGLSLESNPTRRPHIPHGENKGTQQQLF